mmetsp:Transcript_118426/g.334805  ORF Transcript_118426/g.334805 Transcript_118426/m.334805 type:complete len:234 (-) Transcript_118426:846-1547(-)
MMGGSYLATRRGNSSAGRGSRWTRFGRSGSSPTWTGMGALVGKSSCSRCTSSAGCGTGRGHCRNPRLVHLRHWCNSLAPWPHRRSSLHSRRARPGPRAATPRCSRRAPASRLQQTRGPSRASSRAAPVSRALRRIGSGQVRPAIRGAPHLRHHGQRILSLCRHMDPHQLDLRRRRSCLLRRSRACLSPRCKGRSASRPGRTKTWMRQESPTSGTSAGPEEIDATTVQASWSPT